MNKKLKITLFLLFYTPALSYCYDFTYKQPKNMNGFYLQQSFLKQLKNKLKPDVFIETGTCGAATTVQAASIFHEIHTIELSKKLYLKAQERLHKYSNVNLHFGASEEILQKLLPQISGKKLFYLDAHYSGGPTTHSALGVTPILEELAAIKNYQEKDLIIAIDDIRLFGIKLGNQIIDSYVGFPPISQVVDKLYAINPNFNLVLIGDILIAYEQDNISISPVIKSCTRSLLYDDQTNSTIQLLQDEKIISQATGHEKECILRIYPKLNFGIHLFIWQGLIFMHNKNYHQAINCFQTIINKGYTHWRIFWYKAQALYHLNKYIEAKKLLELVLEIENNFSPAQDLLNTIK